MKCNGRPRWPPVFVVIPCRHYFGCSEGFSPGLGGGRFCCGAGGGGAAGGGRGCGGGGRLRVLLWLGWGLHLPWLRRRLHLVLRLRRLHLMLRLRLRRRRRLKATLLRGWLGCRGRRRLRRNWPHNRWLLLRRTARRR